MEVLPPEGRIPVAGEDDVIGTFFVVAPVNQVKEQAGVLLVELTVSNLINNKARGPHEAGEHRSSLLRPAGGCELVPELRCLNEVGFQSMLAALIAECLCQMGLACSGRVDEGQVPVGIHRSQSTNALQLLQINQSLAAQQAKVKVFKGFGTFWGSRLMRRIV